MIAFPKLPAETPDAVAVLIGQQMPVHVVQAEIAAESAAYTVYLCRGSQYREAREYALANLARANKTLAAYDPRLMVRAGGAR